MSKIQNLIAENKLFQAIELIPDYRSTERLMIKSDLSRLERNEIMGTINSSDANLARNRIVARILASAGEELIPAKRITQTTLASVSTDLSESIEKLSLLYKKYNRTKPQFSDEILGLIDQMISYSTKKRLVTGHDLSNRRLKELKNAAEKLYWRDKNLQLNQTEEKGKKILSYLTERIPTYDNIQEAWSLAYSLGMRNPGIEKNLENRPDDIDIRVMLTDAIEAFVDTLAS